MNQYIVIQGPLTFHNEIVNYYTNIQNIIISTSTSESYDSIVNISKLNSPIIYSNSNPDVKSNVNRQCQSASLGLVYAKLLGATHALKIRSDMFISNIELMMNILSNKEKLSFLCWHSQGYLVDYINYGPIDDMINFWTIPKVVSDTFAEQILLDNFTKNNNISPVTFENIKSNVDFFIDDLVKANIHINWVKYGIDVTEYTKDQTYLY